MERSGSRYEDNRKRAVQERKSRRKTRTGVKFLRTVLIALLVLLIAGAVTAAVVIRVIISRAPAISSAQFVPSEAATYICGGDGSRQLKLTLPEANRDLVAMDQIPEDMQHAIVAIEDERFYTHHGIDPKGILRALYKGITTGSFSEGASTITQQLLKNSVFPDWVKESTLKERVVRKIQEQYLALKLEKMLTKKQILEDYLNTINLGAGCYGVQSAAYRYFGKDVSELTLSECTVIAGITQNPTAYNPITYPEKNKKRRTEVLDAMLRQDYITQVQYNEAQADDVYSRIQNNTRDIDTTSSVYTWYQDALIGQVMQDLQDQKGYSYQQAFKAVYAGGLRIYSAQDDGLQEICEQEFENPDNFPSGTEVGIDYALSVEDAEGQITDYGNSDLKSYVRKASDPSWNLMCDTAEQAKTYAEAFKKSVLTDEDTVLGERVTITPQPQASCVVIDQSAGLVKALIGGRGNKDASLTLNRASYTRRQPGSTFKILTAYAPALDEAGMTLSTVYKDEPYSYSDGTPVANAEKSYEGDVTIRDAIVRSINVVAVKCITDVTPETGFQYARKFGITSLVESEQTGEGTLTDINQGLALGGITYGVTDLELTGAYAAIANMGQYIRPSFYTKVEDMYGNVILDSTDAASRTAIRAGTAYLLTSAMEGVISDPQGTAYGKISLGQMPVSGKSGTTSSYRDSWFVGYTPYYTCGIWAGYDNNAVLPDTGTYHTYCKTLWNSIMNRANEGKPAAAFPSTDEVVPESICGESHMAASPGCPDPYTEYYAVGTQPQYYCSMHGDGSLVMGLNEADGSGDLSGPVAGGTDPQDGGTTQGQTSASGGTQLGGQDGIVIYSQDQTILDPSGSGLSGGSGSSAGGSAGDGSGSGAGSTGGITGSSSIGTGSGSNGAGSGTGSSSSGAGSGTGAGSAGTGSGAGGSSSDQHVIEILNNIPEAG